jgi:hypothetical protein
MIIRDLFPLPFCHALRSILCFARTGKYHQQAIVPVFAARVISVLTILAACVSLNGKSSKCFNRFINTPAFIDRIL